jgi:hypothetical protein
MSHYSVLILGPEPETQLDPFWELDLPDDLLAEDYRADFDPVIPSSRFAEAAARITAQAEAAGDECAARYRASLEAKDYAAIFTDAHGGQLSPDGDWGHYFNPQAKWDWFVLGGRSQGQLRLLPGRTGVIGERSWGNADAPVLPGTCDQARAGDIDWPATRQEFTPFAVLKDGDWRDQGQMGWWGAVIDPKAEAAWAAEVDALLKELPPETLVSVYDCHI